jgi:hypothetical protein
MQNPALGAALLSRFVKAYAEAHPEHRATPLPLLFLVLPAVWHEPTAIHIGSTQQRSGLRAFAAKFTEARPPQLDVLLDLHERSRRWRLKSREAMRVAIATGLLRVGTDGRAIASGQEWPIDSQPLTVKVMSNAVVKLAGWCAPLTLHEISLALHVKF